MGLLILLALAGAVSGSVSGGVIGGTDGVLLGGSSGLVGGVMTWFIAGVVGRAVREFRLNRYFSQDGQDTIDVESIIKSNAKSNAESQPASNEREFYRATSRTRDSSASG